MMNVYIEEHLALERVRALRAARRVRASTRIRRPVPRVRAVVLLSCTLVFAALVLAISI